MVKIHVAVIAILSTLYISTQARNVGQYAEEPMDRMVKTNSLLKEAKSQRKFLFCLQKNDWKNDRKRDPILDGIFNWVPFQEHQCSLTFPIRLKI